MAFQDVVVLVGDQLLHRLIIFTVLTSPYEAGALTGPSNEPPSVFRDRNCTDRYFILLGVQLFGCVLGQVPNANSATLITKDNIALVGVEHSRVYHDTIIIEISHKAACFKVEYLQCAILASSKEPFVVFLEF